MTTTLEQQQQEGARVEHDQGQWQPPQPQGTWVFIPDEDEGANAPRASTHGNEAVSQGGGKTRVFFDQPNKPHKPHKHHNASSDSSDSSDSDTDGGAFIFRFGSASTKDQRRALKEQMRSHKQQMRDHHRAMKEQHQEWKAHMRQYKHDVKRGGASLPPPPPPAMFPPPPPGFGHHGPFASMGAFERHGPFQGSSHPPPPGFGFHGPFAPKGSFGFGGPLDRGFSGPSGSFGRHGSGESNMPGVPARFGFTSLPPFSPMSQKEEEACTQVNGSIVRVVENETGWVCREITENGQVKYEFSRNISEMKDKA
ncbi:hypothetical protein BC830DRAFT_1171388 [Chytriomyces sp. MP71]|nr:hypothetical protein BC830DRAFT_1171388 [Chytriomyces sp. MP71]